MAGFPSLALLLGAVATVASAQSVTPSNATIPASESSANIHLYLSGQHQIQQSVFTIIPLTTQAGAGQDPNSLSQLNIAGALKLVDPTSATAVANSDIAYTSCDSNDSNIGTAAVVKTAAANRPAAVLLYSLNAVACNATGDLGYTSIYSMTSAADSSLLVASIQAMPTAPMSAVIATNSSTPSGGAVPSGTTNNGGPAPTTAVAMSILYSITGIITLLFLVIITTGALRAHRHPERYGPRRALHGRPRQSRAKGLARAMLETLPIVKFGDPEPVKSGNRDVELEDGTNSVHNPSEAVATSAAEEGVKSEEIVKGNPDAVPVESGMGPAQEEIVSSDPQTVPGDGELGCSICTEDFTAGEDVRVLPCDHKYHPACIDPWLLNVSGTCPLCRHDLNPTATSTSTLGETSGTEGNDLAPPLGMAEGATEDTNNQGRSRVPRFLDLHRLRHAPPHERIAALRRLREQSRSEVEPAENAEEMSRRHRLTSRLRDRLRVRNRTQNDAPSPASENETTR